MKFSTKGFIVTVMSITLMAGSVACASATSTVAANTNVQVESQTKAVVENDNDSAKADLTKSDETSNKETLTSSALGTVSSGLNINQGKIGDITVTEYFDTNTGTKNKPIIICEHGLSGSRQDCVALATGYAELGYYVITPDAYLHGDRISDEKLSVLEIAVKTATEIDTLLDYCSKQSLCNMDKIGLVGFSMGGIECYYYIANGKYQISAAGIVCSTPQWSEIAKSGLAHSYYTNGETKSIISPFEKSRITKFIKNSSPFDTLVNLKYQTKILAISGKDDTIIPFEGSLDLYNKVKSKNPSDVYELKSNHGHEITGEDIAELATFMAQNLSIN